MAEPRTQTVVKGQQTALDKNVFTNPSGEIFVGWNTERDGAGTQYQDQQQVITEEALTLYAQWGHRITWDANGGSAVQPWYRKTNTQLGTLPTTTRTEFTFNGWYTAASGGTKIEQTSLVASPATYYAHWSGQVYNCTRDYYHQNGVIWKNLPKGTYKVNINKFYAEHTGHTKSHEYSPIIMAINAQNTSKVYEFPFYGNLSDNTSSVKIVKNKVPIFRNGQSQLLDGVVINNLNDNITQFSLTIPEITFPYEKNKITFTGYDYNKCGKWSWNLSWSQNSDILVKFTRIR